MVEGEFDFGEFCFSVRHGAVYDAGAEVWGEDAGVQDEDGDEGGDAELAYFEDVVAGVAVFVEVQLRPVGFETDGSPCFVGYPVKVGEPPELV